jgi:hypothetical protein
VIEPWAYGVTTVPARLKTLLPHTLESLKRAGFPKPRLFIDGIGDDGPYRQFGLETTVHYPAVRTFGNWLLAAWELYVRQPQARFYALFQDDCLLCQNVRSYLEACRKPENSYLNLFTFATNEHLIRMEPKGWHKSDQTGKGAVALVFDHVAMATLLKQPGLVNKPQNINGHQNLDGAIQDALVRCAGFTEYIHNPSLAQHVDSDTTITCEGPTLHPIRQPQAKTFPGENFDAMDLLK